jgi:hypothetical protein
MSNDSGVQNYGQQQPAPNPAYGQQPPGPGHGQWQAPQPPAPKKPFFKRTWVIVTGAVLAVFVVIGVASGGGSGPQAGGDAAADQPSGGVTSSGEPAGQATQPAKKPAAPPAAKGWVKLVTLSGAADKNSDTIKTTGGKLRISYNFTDPGKSGFIVAAVYFLDEGVDPMKDGALPDVMISEPGKDVTTIRKDAGEYYLKITAANTKYSVTVEEER